MLHRVAALLLFAALPAQAEPHRLRAEAQVSGEIVRLGDLVEEAGPLAATPLFRAPALGASGTISAARVEEAARELGLPSLANDGPQAILIRRPATIVAAAELEAALTAALAAADARLDQAVIKVDAAPADMRRDSGDSTAPSVTFDRMDPAGGRFEARLRIGGAEQRIAGHAEPTLPVPVLTRPLARGETVRAADMAPQRRPAREVMAAGSPSLQSIPGLTARRALAAGQILREADLVRPDLVERNQPVTITYEAPGLALTLKGKALAAGAVGAIVPVQNLASKRSLDAVVIGPGKVSARLNAQP